MLVGPGASEKIAIDAPVGTKDAGVVPVLHLAGVGIDGIATPIDLPPVPLTVDPERTADEN